MKRFFLALTILFSAISFISCNDSDKKDEELKASDVPASVQSAFTAKYPAVSDVKWEKAKEGDKQTYKVKFKSGDKETKAEFGEDGSFIKEKTEE